MYGLEAKFDLIGFTTKGKIYLLYDIVYGSKSYLTMYGQNKRIFSKFHTDKMICYTRFFYTQEETLSRIRRNKLLKILT